MQALVLQNTSSKAGGHRAGSVVDVPEDLIAKLPEFYRPVGDQVQIDAAAERSEQAAAAHLVEDRLARKRALARAEADRKAAEADRLMKEAAYRMQLAEEAKRQAAESAARAEAMAAAAPASAPAPAASAPADLPAAPAAPESVPPHKRSRKAE